MKRQKVKIVGYKGRYGFSDQSAEVFGPIISGMAREAQTKGKRLTPGDVVKKASSQDSELYDFFEWDNMKSAHQYRLAQARRLIKGYKAIYEVAQNAGKVKRLTVTGMYNVGDTQDVVSSVKQQVVMTRVEPETHGRGYVTAGALLRDDVLLQSVKQDFRNRLRNLRTEYHELLAAEEEFDRLFRVIDEVLEIKESVAA